MKFFLALACLVALGSAKPASNADDAEWENYKRAYGKNYGGANSELENVRKTLYFQAKEFVQAHNELYNKGLKSYNLALNQFADHHPSEVAQMLNGYKPSQGRNAEVFVPLNTTVPENVDWRSKNAVTPVKNQGQCGSCWAFSTTGSLEGQWAIKKGKLVSLSEQQLVDCSGDEGNDGCEGGLMDQGFEYIKANKGIDTEQSYPYTAEDDSCAFKKANVAATVTGYKDIKSGSESDLKNAVATVGPISVAIDASSWGFQLYSSGVYDDDSCSSSSLDHGVLAVGYGTENGSDFWLVKNSWGASWGLSGYIKMSRNKSNQCGIATQASYPLVQ